MRVIVRCLARASVVVGLLCMAARPVMAQDFSSPAISTSATGDVQVVPDHAQIQVSVQTRAASAAEAASENATKQTAVIAAIRKLGIDASQISTQGYSVIPETRNDKQDQTPRVVSYLVSNTVSIELSDISFVGRVLDSAIGAGANEISSVSLYRKDTQDAFQDALAVAVKRARGQASAIAAAAGGRLGPMLDLSSNGSSPPVLFMKAARMSAFAGAETPISAGQATITASVSARWVFIPNP